MIAIPDIALESNLDQKDVENVKRVVNDFWVACLSREASLLGRKEVLTGKAKFGILGDGKEIPQVALAHFFKKGDFRSGYYRDQTWMFALGLCTVEDYFAQLYADPAQDPFSGGRQMNNHFATALIDNNDNWLKHTDCYNVSSDVSSTGGQMARALGLAIASKKYRALPEIDKSKQFSNDGNEVVFCSIGDASTSEGIFWETMNAAAVAKVPLAVMVWDDGYGISVPTDLQTTKGNISKALEGFREDEDGGILIYTVKAWDYAGLINVYDRAISQIREEHRPVLIHVTECTQPQGHSTSGSHERYKSKERLEWEKEFDGLKIMEEWILENEFASQEELDKLKAEAKAKVKEGSKAAWKKYQDGINTKRKELLNIIQEIPATQTSQKIAEELSKPLPLAFGEVTGMARQLRSEMLIQSTPVPDSLETFVGGAKDYGVTTYDSHLYSNSDKSALAIPVIAPIYKDDSKLLNGYEIINKFFDEIFEKYPHTFAFGEDVGNIGDVNQGFAGLQEKYGEQRIFDTGIREWSIMGQAIGMAMRGLRPIAEIQYIDYLIYGLAPLTDDLATLRYRSNNLQMAPALIRTRGHRLEGIWHAGSPLSLMLGSLRGMYICVPRNFVQAAGMYNTLLQSSDPGIVVEVLNGYRIKERLPENLSEFTVSLGVPDIITKGQDLTIVTYGPNVRYAQEAIERMAALPYSIELIDVQTLIPFDLEHKISESLKKTNKVLFLDEDVPGGSTAFMMQKVLEEQGGYFYLDGKPRTLSAKEHRCAFGSDGDYFSKPQVEDIVEVVMEMLAE